MRTLRECNPAVAFAFFMAVLALTMFTMNPYLLLISLCGSWLYALITEGRSALRALPMQLALFAVTAVLNPIFSRNGATVLFVVNDSPVTKEAVLYGLAAGAMLAASFGWLRSFTKLMTSDKLLYVFGLVSPKAALLLSMALRYVPLFGEQAVKIRRAQTACGMYKDGGVPAHIRGELRVFSVMVTWTLENGIITADSMAARGYGVGRRSRFSPQRFTPRDGALLGAIAALLGGAAAGAFGGVFRFDYYPVVAAAAPGAAGALAYASCALLALLPSALEIAEGIKWRCLRSKI